VYQTNKIVQALYKYSPKFIHDFMYSVHGLIKISQHNMIKKNYLNNFEKIENLPLEEIKSLQFEKLKKMINHSYKNVPFYRNLFTNLQLDPGDIKSLDDMKLIPTLKKNDILKNYDDLIALNSIQFNPTQRSTGGTTGTSLSFLMDERNYTLRETELLNHWKQHSYNSDKDRSIVFRADVLIPRGRKIKKAWRYDLLRKTYHFSAYYTSEDILFEYYSIMKNFRPKYMQALPSTAYIFAKYLNQNNYKINLNKVFTSSEILYESYRNEIERAFNCEIIDHYGHGEPGTYVAGQCKDGNYHIPCSNVYFEISNDGTIIETSLNNYSMPFIRYEIEDRVDKIFYNCGCGKQTPYFKKIFGRVSDYLVTPDGRTITGIGFDQVFKGTNILNGQIIQTDLNHININIVPQENYSEYNKNELLNKLRERLGNDIKISINIVERIDLTPGGKQKLVISKINKSTNF